MLRHLRTVFDLDRDEILSLFDLAREMKKYPGRFGDSLKGRTLAMIFEKPSLRTRVTFQTGIFQLGGQGIYLAPSDIKIGKRETTQDIARNLSRWCDIVMFRTFAHKKIQELAAGSSIPVINALCDSYHPCQALADIFTLYERRHDVHNLKLAYVGDGNNVLHSLINISAILGIQLSYATPEGYEPKEDVLKLAQDYATQHNSGATFEATHVPAEAVKDADAVYTDVWASMGQEDQAAARRKIFEPYQVNAELMKHTKPGAWFMHCLPAHRGEEVTDEVVDAHYSVVFDQAENRMHAQKALMYMLIKR